MLRTLFACACLSAGTLGAQNFTLTSKDIGGQGTALLEFDGFGCKGRNQSPQLAWSDAPAGTRSFAVTLYDPDAPTGSGWWHWVVYDIPVTESAIPTGAGNPEGRGLPKGARQGRTDYGKAGYGGPCPPPGHGFHQYILTVYALGVDRLDVGPDPSPALVGFNLNANALAKASLVFYYKR
jgi:Raf kinase inhibitor-like YbhB/YbcL family protein